MVDLTDTVTVPTTFTSLNDHQIGTLKSLVDPLSYCEDHGITFYAAVQAFLRTILA